MSTAVVEDKRNSLKKNKHENGLYIYKVANAHTRTHTLINELKTKMEGN